MQIHYSIDVPLFNPAQNYRLSGEIYEASGDFGEAVTHYEKTLNTDERVGVKRASCKTSKLEGAQAVFARFI